MPTDDIQTIDAVIAELDRIIALARTRGSRHGYFAALYRGTTIRVRDHIRQGKFRHPERLARLDVCFARYYFEAERAWSSGQRPSDSWRAAFEAERDDSVLIVQHLLLGMNAHINLDLGQATAETAPGALADLDPDYRHLNRILKDMIDDVQDVLAPVSPWLRWVDRLGGPEDESLAGFSITIARDQAWQAAQTLDVMADAHSKAAFVRELDRKTRVLARVVQIAGGWIAPLVRWRERDRKGRPEDVRAVIDAMVAAFPG